MISPIPRHTFRQLVRLATDKAARHCSAILLAAVICIPVADADLPDLGDPTLDSFSSKQEQQLGLAFYRSLRANLNFVDDLQINDYLNNLGNKLASHSDAAGNPFHFFIIEAPTINAFAGPAGYIGIHTRLILDAENESQLAGVLAHEVAHVSQRHLARAFDNSGNSTAITIATLLAAILVGTQDGQAGQAVLLSGIAGSQQSSINFTRSNEYEAVRLGIGILTESGINPQGMVEFFEILLDESSDNGIEYLRTHPLNENRVSEAKDRVKETALTLPADTLDYQFFRARLIMLLSKTPESYLKDDTIDGLIGRYQKALAAIRLQQGSMAIEILQELAEQNQHPWIRLALAEAYATNHDDLKALSELESLYKLYPRYLPVTMALAEALSRLGKSDRIISLLKRQLQNDDEAIIYKALANAYYANGQTGAALEATGDQYVRQGYLELALEQYNNALRQKDISESSRSRLEATKTELTELIQLQRDSL